MDEETIEISRSARRNILTLSRQKKRDDEADIRRSINNFGINPDTIMAIVNKLKTKSTVSVSELQTLKNALIDDDSYVQVVLNVNGALRGLVRELTGNDVNKQCAAAGCCCNLALGDSRAGLAVATSAGAYLVAALDNLTTEFAVTCAWTLGNLAASGPKACELLTTQGAVTKLIELLCNSSGELRDAALYALFRFAQQLSNQLRTEHLHKMLEVLPYFELNATSQLLFTLSCHEVFSPSLVSQDFLYKILQYLTININTDSDSITHIFRFIANINCKEVYNLVLSFIVENNMLATIKLLSEINESVAWFLGNAYVLCSDHVIYNML